MHCPLVVGINNHGVECLESGDLTRAMECFRIALSQLRLHLDTFPSSSTTRSNVQVRTAASSTTINKTRPHHQGDTTTSASTPTPMIRPLPPNTEIETSFLFPFGPSSSATLSFELHNGGEGSSTTPSSSVSSDASNYKKTTLLFCRGLRLVDSTGGAKPCFSNDPLHEELLCSSLVMFNLALAYHLHGVLRVGQTSSQQGRGSGVQQRRMNKQHSSEKLGTKSSSSYSSNEMLIEAKELYRTAYEQVVFVMGEIDEQQQQQSQKMQPSTPLSGLAGINALLDLLVMAVGNNFAQLLLIMQERGRSSESDDIMDFEDDESMENEGDDHSSSASSTGDDTIEEDSDDDDEDMIRELYSQVVQLAVAIQSSSSMLMMDHDSSDDVSMDSSTDDERRLFAMLHHTANGFLFNAVLAGLYPPNGAPAA